MLLLVGLVGTVSACNSQPARPTEDAAPAHQAPPPPAVDGADAADVMEGTRRAAADGATLVAISFSDRGGEPPRRRWVRPAHAEAEVRARRAELAAEVARLPEGERPRVTALLDALASVSAVEGSFGDPTRIGTDLAASVGILQWAARRGRPIDADSSLYELLAAIARRARAGDPLGRASQRELARANITIDRKGVRLARRAVPAERLVAALLPVAGAGATRTIQLAIAADVAEALYAKHGPLFPSEEGRALLLSLHVNRPAWVAPAVARAVADAAAEDVAARVAAFRRAAIESYPPGDRVRRARRYATAIFTGR